MFCFRREFLKGYGVSQAELSRLTGIPRSTNKEIIKGRRSIQAEVAYALGLFFRMDPTRHLLIRIPWTPRWRGLPSIDSATKGAV